MGQDISDRISTPAPCPVAGHSSRLPAASVWRQWWPAAVGAGLILAAVAALAVDCPLAMACREADWPEPFREALPLLRLFEPFGHGLGVLVILLAMRQLDPARRWALPRVLACSWASGLAADGIKLLIVRIRPHSYDLQDGVWSTFGQRLPGIAAGNAGQSFPSAHVATAAGLAMALVRLYPRGRTFFVAMVFLVAGQRIAAGDHYLSDVLCGAALGIIVAGGLLNGGWFTELFDRLEDCCKTRRTSPS